MSHRTDRSAVESDRDCGRNRQGFKTCKRRINIIDQLSPLVISIQGYRSIESDSSNSKRPRRSSIKRNNTRFAGDSSAGSW